MSLESPDDLSHFERAELWFAYPNLASVLLRDHGELSPKLFDLTRARAREELAELLRARKSARVLR